MGLGVVVGVEECVGEGCEVSGAVGVAEGVGLEGWWVATVAGVAVATEVTLASKVDALDRVLVEEAGGAGLALPMVSPTVNSAISRPQSWPPDLFMFITLGQNPLAEVFLLDGH